MVDYMKAIKRPLQDPLTLIIGTIIGFIPVLQALLVGYAAQSAQNTFKKSYALPKWALSIKNIVDLVIKTILIIVIEIVYFIPAIIVMAIGGTAILAAALGAAAQGGQVDMMALMMPAIATGGIFILLGLLLAVVGGVMSIMGIMFFLKEGNFMSAFKFGSVLKKVLTVNFWLSAIVLFIYGLVLMLILGLIALIPVIGGVLAIIGYGLMMFLMATTSYTVFANVFMETP